MSKKTWITCEKWERLNGVVLPLMTPSEILVIAKIAARDCHGSTTEKRLAALGIPVPPAKGWMRALEYKCLATYAPAALAQRRFD